MIDKDMVIIIFCIIIICGGIGVILSEYPEYMQWRLRRCMSKLTGRIYW